MNKIRKIHLIGILTIGFIAPQAWAQQLYVPFKVGIAGGICNTAAIGSANPEIQIDGNAPGGTFLVNSILLKTDSVPINGFFSLNVNTVTIDGTRFDTRTATLVGHVEGTGVDHSVDIMGTPVRVTGSQDQYNPGGNFPHQIVANSAGASDIVVQFFCRSDLEDLNITTILVSGWKRAPETITVTYLPGS